jgi:hypothetical protein
MKVKILFFEPIVDALPKVGYVDFKVEYELDKWEIFRGCTYFKKADKKWISPGVIKRGDKFLQRYERNPSFGKIVSNVIKELESYIELNPRSAIKSASLWQELPK